MSAKAMPRTIPTSVVSHDGVGSLAPVIVQESILAGEYAYSESVWWPTEATDITAPTVTYRHRSPISGDVEALVQTDDAIASLRFDGTCVRVLAAGRTEDVVTSLICELQDLVPLDVIGASDPRVTVTFWSLGPHGPVQRPRKIGVPTWEEVRPNYTADVAEQLDQLTSRDFVPGASGQLVLWHGKPGTGKTWALRAMASEWRSWCDVHYITDPDDFFGRSAAYMLEVLLADDYALEHAKLAAEGGLLDDDPDPRADDGRWRVLLLEDTGELLSADARERSGQGLSRLLNVVDGLIGQGLRILVLVTTNEELRTLHPAVQRPGRCAAKIDFKGLTNEEARAWLTAHGADELALAKVGEGTAVADLYASLAGTRTNDEHQPIGFAA